MSTDEEDLFSLDLFSFQALAEKLSGHAPEHGVNCICMDRLIREVRDQLVRQAGSGRHQDVRDRLYYVLTKAVQ